MAPNNRLEEDVEVLPSMEEKSGLQGLVNLEKYPLHDEDVFDNLVKESREKFLNDCVVTFPNFLTKEALDSLVKESNNNQIQAYFPNNVKKTEHNIYFSQEDDPDFPPSHLNNRKVISNKGCVTTDLIPPDSHLLSLYYNQTFLKFLESVLKVEKLYDYKDPLSSVTVHYAMEGQELGWHFDNSPFSTTLLIQKPESDGGIFEFMPNVRDEENADEIVHGVLDGKVAPKQLDIDPGTLILFSGKRSLHRVSKVVGNTTRILVVFAYNEKERMELSKSGMQLFFGRTATGEEKKE